MATAQEIQRWHIRIEKAKSAGRLDLAQPAQEREAALLRQGNQLWGQMQGFKERINQAKELGRQIQVRRQEVRTKAVEAEAARVKSKAQPRVETAGWTQSPRNISSGADPLEDKFRHWEMDDELNQLRRNIER